MLACELLRVGRLCLKTVDVADVVARTGGLVGPVPLHDRHSGRWGVAAAELVVETGIAIGQGKRGVHW